MNQEQEDRLAESLDEALYSLTVARDHLSTGANAVEGTKHVSVLEHYIRVLEQACEEIQTHFDSQGLI